MSKIKLLSIVGARPQIIKSSAISRTIRDIYTEKVDEKILHTGQHYDRGMSEVFFEELEIPVPDYNLGVGSARHGRQTASMISGIEDVLISDRPDVVVIYGDTNSTLAAAIATSKLKIPLVHVEAGLRSFNKSMPEEVNRILSDHVSTLLFAPTDAALKNLMREGFRPDNSPPFSMDNPKIFLSGDIMYDNSLFYADLLPRKNYRTFLPKTISKWVDLFSVQSIGN
ncbi:MAG: UDP-N-acetylglucosamine 2-epimerase [Bacteroidales bacterium]